MPPLHTLDGFCTLTTALACSQLLLPTHTPLAHLLPLAHFRHSCAFATALAQLRPTLHTCTPSCTLLPALAHSRTVVPLLALSPSPCTLAKALALSRPALHPYPPLHTYACSCTLTFPLAHSRPALHPHPLLAHLRPLLHPHSPLAHSRTLLLSHSLTLSLTLSRSHAHYSHACTLLTLAHTLPHSCTLSHKVCELLELRSGKAGACSGLALAAFWSVLAFWQRH